jgi:CDP-glucose 4,6-dehydratase
VFTNNYAGKKVLITGHTGFKGSWLSAWLLKLGANVAGVSKDIPTNPSMFEEIELSQRLQHYIGDLRDLAYVRQVVEEVRPDYVFHLAAQAIVSTSYIEPVETLSTNIMGTMNVLEALRQYNSACTAIMITSDKCYENVEWVWGYRESDRLGGKDIYSGSKGCAELVIRSYVQSFFGQDSAVRIGIGRAGNVIGGGDWAKSRIVADCIRNWSQDKRVEIRCPDATRPWQHVLEPLSGYLLLGERMSVIPELHGEAFNFGPRSNKNHTVLDLLHSLSLIWGHLNINEAYTITDNIPFKESGLLKLNCDKALSQLSWEASLDYQDTVRLVGEWYKKYYAENSGLWKFTIDQIQQYEEISTQKNICWAI